MAQKLAQLTVGFDAMHPLLKTPKAIGVIAKELKFRPLIGYSITKSLTNTPR